MITTIPRRRGGGASRAVLIGGLAASVFDFVAAMLIYGVSWQVIGQSIAAGVLGGEAARAGGVQTAVLGAALHTLILLAAAALYVWAGRRFGILFRQPVIMGLLYGAAIYLVMNYLVVPLSLAPANPNPLATDTKTLLNMASHLFLVGLPIALAAAGARRR